MKVNTGKVNTGKVNTGKVNTAGGGDAGAEERTPEQRRALFRVVRGQPDDHELAALTAVLAASASAASASSRSASPARTSFWVDRQAAVRRPGHPGPGAWRTHFLPR